MGRIGYDLHAVEQNRPLAQVEHFSRHLGGSSANIAIGLSRLGLRVGIISCLGKDALADYLLGFLEQEGVDTQHVGLAEGYNTSLCLTEVCPPDRFGQVFYRRDAADTQVTLGLQQKDYLQQARLFVTNGTSLCVSPAREATQQALQAARAAGQQTALDIDYRESSWPSAAEAGRQARLAMAWVDVVIGNEPELALLTEETEPGAQVQRALDLGARLVVRKRGGVPSCASRAGGDGEHHRSRRRLRLRLSLRSVPELSLAQLSTLRKRGGGRGGQPGKLFGRHAPAAGSGGEAPHL
jgi:5-dehydro-2-deoxygluconokinase